MRVTLISVIEVTLIVAVVCLAIIAASATFIFIRRVVLGGC
jgi:hypothetical protein